MNLKPLILLILLSSAIIPSNADFPRHIDPTLLTLDNLDPDALFEVYSGIYGSIVQSKYAEAFGFIGAR